MKSSTRPRSWLPPKSAFAGFRFPPEVIVVAVRWYLGYSLSYRDVEELLIERGIEVDHVSDGGTPFSGVPLLRTVLATRRGTRLKQPGVGRLLYPGAVVLSWPTQ